MSLGIAFKCAEGIVLAADSRVTLTAQMPQPGGAPNIVLPCTYDNATKLLQVRSHNYVGAVTFGLGTIGTQSQRTAHSFMPEFEAKLAATGIARLSVEQFARELSDFFMEQWKASGMPTAYPGPDIIFYVGGFDEGAPYGRLFELSIPNNPNPKEWHSAPTAFGPIWGGQREFVDRLLKGVDASLPEKITKELGLDAGAQTKLAQQIATVELAIPYPFLSLQDSIDLSILLIRTTIALQSFQVGIRGVGGAIDVVAITKTDGLTYVQQKKIRGENA